MKLRFALSITTAVALTAFQVTLAEPAVPASATLSTAVTIATGTIDNAQGHAVSGATVDLYALPPLSVWPGQSNPPVGSHVP